MRGDSEKEKKKKNLSIDCIWYRFTRDYGEMVRMVQLYVYSLSILLLHTTLFDENAISEGSVPIEYERGRLIETMSMDRAHWRIIDK